MRCYKVGIIGCGVISKTYIKDIKRLFQNNLDIVAVSDTDLSKAREKAEEFQINRFCTPNELLDIEDIDIVINLTPPKMHYSVNKKILQSGKHVFCEKPISLSLDEALELKKIAETKKLQIGCAPDTFMGSSIKTCSKLIEDGWIGKALYVNANMMSCGVETWHPAPVPFYQAGGGPIFDMGGYYLSALVMLFGSIREVYSCSRTGFSEREAFCGPMKGKKFQVQTPTFYSVILQMQSGVVVTMNISFDIWNSSLPFMEVYGTEGTLQIPDPNMYGGTPKVFRKEQKLGALFDAGTISDSPYSIPEVYQNVGNYVRGIGVNDLAESISRGVRCSANIDLAIHVLDGMLSIIHSGETGQSISLSTSYSEESSI